MLSSSKLTEFVTRLPRIAVLSTAIAFFVIPLIWLVMAPTKSDSQLASGEALTYGSLSNVGVAWDNLLSFRDGILLTWIANSIWYSVVSLALLLVCCVPAGYALAVMRFRARDTILRLTLVAMLTPLVALVVPLFLEMDLFGMLNSPWAVILPSAFYPFGVYLSVIFFQTSIPFELLEAARVDGAGEFRIFYSVVTPVSRSLVGLVAFFGFISTWQNFFMPFVMLTSTERLTLPVGLSALVSGSPALNPALGGSSIPIRRPEIALAGLVLVVPVLVLFVALQRYLTSGSLLGTIKS